MNKKELINNFDELSVDDKKMLLDIYNNNSFNTLIDIHNDEFTTFDDIDDHIDKMDEDELWDKFCNEKFSYHQMYDLLISNISTKDILYMLKEILADEYGENNFTLSLNTLDDLYKYEIVNKLCYKYTSYQLEEKLQHLL